MQYGSIYIVRHGDTNYNSTSGGTEKIRGHLDTPETQLNAAGIDTAKKVGKRLKPENINVVVSSPLSRAHDTGKHIHENVVTDDALTPWNLGKFQGQPARDIVKRIPYYLDNPDEAVPGGESFNSFKNRFADGMNRILQRAWSGENVAVTTHYRNVRLTQAWLKAGGDWDKIDTNKLFTKDDDMKPGTILKLTFNPTNKEAQ